MWVEIIEVKKSENGAMGNFYPSGKGKYRHFRISMSLHHNKTLADYSLTLLHELLHLWVLCLRYKGFAVKNTTEHRFINAVEKNLLSQIKYLKPIRRRKKNVKKKKK